MIWLSEASFHAGVCLLQQLNVVEPAGMPSDMRGFHHGDEIHVHVNANGHPHCCTLTISLHSAMCPYFTTGSCLRRIITGSLLLLIDLHDLVAQTRKPSMPLTMEHNNPRDS